MSETVYSIRSFILQMTKVYSDGRVEALPPVLNTIQTTYRILLAKLTSGKVATPITYMEVGQGSAGWDPGAGPAPGAANTALVAPLARVGAFNPATDWDYLVEPATTPETVSGSPTGRVRVTASFATGVANGTLREVALWGGAAATATLSTGDLVNVIRFVAVNKPSGGADFTLVAQLILQYAFLLFVVSTIFTSLGMA